MRRFVPSAQFARFGLAQGGSTAIEYALIASGISIAILGATTTLGSEIMTVFYDKLSNLF